MNNFYKATELIIQRLADNPLVNTVIFARTEEKDLYKKQIYPLAHIVPISAPWTTSQVNQFTFQVGVVEQRDINKQQTNSKFEGNDNVIDNLNVCHVVLNDLLTWLETQNNEDRIELVSVDSLDPLLFTDYNIMDGWVAQFTLSCPNDTISTC